MQPSQDNQEVINLVTPPASPNPEEISSPEADSDFKCENPSSDDDDSSLQEEGEKSDKKYVSLESEEEDNADSSDDEFGPRFLARVANDLHACLVKHGLRRKSHVAKSDISREFGHIVREFFKDAASEAGQIIVDVIEGDKLVASHDINLKHSRAGN